MTSLKKVMVTIFMFFTSLASHSSPFVWPASGRSDHIANPFVITGFNPATQMLTGFVSAVRIAPGRTDECSFVFSGMLKKSNKLKISYIYRIGDEAMESTIEQDGLLVYSDVGQPKLQIQKPLAHEDCDWILPFVGEPHIEESEQAISISLRERSVGDWIGVYAIKSKRARFYRLPDNSSAKKSFVVSGDVVYVYKWEADWCYAKFEKNGKATEGWLRKADILQAEDE